MPNQSYATALIDVKGLTNITAFGYLKLAT